MATVGHADLEATLGLLRAQCADPRAGIFGPIFLLFFLVVKPEKTGTAAVIIQALLMILIFVPLTYYVDKAAYRSYHKRLATGTKR